MRRVTYGVLECCCTLCWLGKHCSVMKLAIHCSKRYDVQCLMCVFTCGQRSLPRSCKLAKNTLKGKTIGHEK